MNSSASVSAVLAHTRVAARPGDAHEGQPLAAALAVEGDRADLDQMPMGRVFPPRRSSGVGRPGEAAAKRSVQLGCHAPSGGGMSREALFVRW